MNKEKILYWVSVKWPTGFYILEIILEHWRTIKQNEYDCYFFIADFIFAHNSPDDTKELKEHVLHVVSEYIACGLDPEKWRFIVRAICLRPQNCIYIWICWLTKENWKNHHF